MIYGKVSAEGKTWTVSAPLGSDLPACITKIVSPSATPTYLPVSVKNPWNVLDSFCLFKGGYTLRLTLPHMGRSLRLNHLNKESNLPKPGKKPGISSQRRLSSLTTKTSVLLEGNSVPLSEKGLMGWPQVS